MSYIRTCALSCLLLLTLHLRSSSAAEPLRFAYQNRIGDAVSIIAVTQNLFAAEGLPVKALLFNNGPACSEALFTGTVDIATMGDTAAVVAVSRAADLRIIGSHGDGETRHRIMVGRNSRIMQVTDLKGKRLAVKKGSSTHGGLLLFLSSKGIHLADLKLVELDPALMPDALAAGSVDAFVASEPTPSLVEQKGARELAHLGGLGNNYPLLLLAKTSTLTKRDDDIRRFFRALARAEQFIRKYPEKSAVILGTETGLTSALTRKAMQRHSYHLQLDQTSLKSLVATACFLKGQQKITQLPVIERVIDNRFLK